MFVFLKTNSCLSLFGMGVMIELKEKLFVLIIQWGIAYGKFLYFCFSSTNGMG